MQWTSETKKAISVSIVYVNDALHYKLINVCNLSISTLFPPSGEQRHLSWTLGYMGTVHTLGLKRRMSHYLLITKTHSVIVKANNSERKCFHVISCLKEIWKVWHWRTYNVEELSYFCNEQCGWCVWTQWFAFLP